MYKNFTHYFNENLGKNNLNAAFSSFAEGLGKKLFIGNNQNGCCEFVPDGEYVEGILLSDEVVEILEALNCKIEPSLNEIEGKDSKEAIVVKIMENENTYKCDVFTDMLSGCIANWIDMRSLKKLN